MILPGASPQKSRMPARHTKVVLGHMTSRPLTPSSLDLCEKLRAQLHGLVLAIASCGANFTSLMFRASVGL